MQSLQVMRRTTEQSQASTNPISHNIHILACLWVTSKCAESAASLPAPHPPQGFPHQSEQYISCGERGGFTLVAAGFLGSSGEVFMLYELPLGGRMVGWKAGGWWSVRGYCGCGQESCCCCWWVTDSAGEMLRWVAALAGPSYGPEVRRKPGSRLSGRPAFPHLESSF